MSNPRDVAVLALRDRDGNVSARLRRLAEGPALSPQDKSLAVELALGAVRMKGMLRCVLRAFLDQPNRRLPTPLEEILLVALYEVLLLQRVPDFARNLLSRASKTSSGCTSGRRFSGGGS